MSRSFKKNPGWVDRNPFMKNYANRRVRRTPVDEEIGNYRKYARRTCPWDICDWRCIEFGGWKAYRKMCEDRTHRWETMYPNSRLAKETEEDWRMEYIRARMK